MGFLDELIGAVNEFNALRDEVVGAFTDTVSQVVQPIQEVTSTVSESSTQLMQEAGLQPKTDASPSSSLPAGE